MIIDRRLPVFCSNDDERRVEEVLILQLLYHLTDSCVHKLDLVPQRCRRSPRVIRVTAQNPAFDELLAYADSLEVHTEQIRYTQSVRAEVRHAANPIDDRIDLERVVALNVQKTVGP